LNSREISLGFNLERLQEASLHEGLILGRVISQSKELYKVATSDSEIIAEITGKFRYDAASVVDFPAVGDYVMIDHANSASGIAIIHYVLKRKSIFERKAAGTGQGTQIIAVNIDTVFICMALNNDFNLRRLERYLSIAWASGALPVVVLTKADLCNNLAEKITDVNSAAAGADILVTNSLSEDGYRPIRQYVTPGKTVAFIGSSGVGKSTLVNRLLGNEIIETKEIRKDDKGRHTTSRRELILVPGGGAVIDTPGMRELGIESADLARSFADIDLLAESCRFSDCSHSSEPQCAVRKAIETGDLSEKRLENYLKLKKEARYEGLNAKQIEKEKINVMFSGFGGRKNARNFIKNKNKHSK